MSLFSFSCCSEIPLPPSVQGPAAHIRRFQDFGLALYLGHKTVFLLAFTTMSIFFTAIVTQEAVELHTWLDPAYAWVYISKAMAVLSGVCRPTLYVIDETMLPKVAKPFATPFTVVWCATPFTVVWCATVVAASVAVPFLTCAQCSPRPSGLCVDIS